MTIRNRRLASAVFVLLASASFGVPPVFARDTEVKITDRSGTTLLLEEDVQDRVGNADILLLGELHDNPEHHRAQGVMMTWAFDAYSNTTPTVVFEMLDRSQQDALDRYDGGAQDFAAAMMWEERGWPAATLYQPVFDAAFASNARLVAGDLPRAELRALHTTGPDPLTPAIRMAYDSINPVSPELQENLISIQFDAHCQLMPKDMMAGMVVMQRARDAALAEAVLSAYQIHGPPVVLIAGSGHVRDDFGTGAMLKRLLPDVDILAVGMTEILESDSNEDQGSHIQPRAKPQPFDLVWATPAIERPDPCESLRERFGQAHSSTKETSD